MTTGAKTVLNKYIDQKRITNPLKYAHEDIFRIGSNILAPQWRLMHCPTIHHDQKIIHKPLSLREVCDDQIRRKKKKNM